MASGSFSLSPALLGGYQASIAPFYHHALVIDKWAHPFVHEVMEELQQDPRQPLMLALFGLALLLVILRVNFKPI